MYGGSFNICHFGKEGLDILNDNMADALLPREISTARTLFIDMVADICLYFIDTFFFV